MMNKRQNLKKAYHGFKKLVNSNKYTKSVALRAKNLAIKAIGHSGPRELYNLTSFYPSIQDYYNQINDAELVESPLISILLPTYNTPEDYLRECINSIIIQSYSRWELCIADDNSTDKNVIKVINEYIRKDKRIKLVARKQNGHISEATNSALEIATGEFVALMDHDDVLWPNALYEMVKTINNNTLVDFIYSDEDKIDGSGKIHSYPFLKPDFSPEFLESCNYITHFSCIRTSIMREINGFRKGYEGAQDWDLFLRISERTQNIIHIPKILYSWRIHEASTASNTDAKPYVYEAQRKLLIDHIERTNMTGDVEKGIITQHRTIKYDIRDGNDVSVVVFISDVIKTKRLLASLNSHSSGMKYEAILCSEFDISPADQKVLSNLLENAGSCTFVKIRGTGRYSIGLKASNTNNVIFMEDSVSVVTDNWAKTFVADTQRQGIGMVGPVLLDESKVNIASAGVGVGYGETGLVDMLHDMPLDDPHYSRGLYAKSRRNVSALNPVIFGVNRIVLDKFYKEKMKPIELADALLSQGYRHVYTPYIQFIYHEYEAVNDIKRDNYTDYEEDLLLNPNFNHANGRMEVKA